MKQHIKLFVLCIISLLPTELSAQAFLTSGREEGFIPIETITVFDKTNLKMLQMPVKFELFTNNGKITHVDKKHGCVSVHHKDMINDSMRVIVEADGYRKGEIICYKILHNGFGLFLSPIDYYANEIIVKGDRIEVTINKKTTVFNAAQLRQSKDEEIFQTLFNLPGFKFDGKSVKVNGYMLEYIFINNTYYRFHEDSSSYTEIIQILKKIQKSKKNK